MNIASIHVQFGFFAFFSILKLISLQSSGLDFLDLPEATHNISSFFCIIKICEKFFRSEKAVIGSLVVVNLQNATDFHSDLILMLNERTNYEMGVMTKDATKKHGNPAHVVDKAKNYFLVFNRTSEVTDAINQWNKLPTWNPLAQVLVLFMNYYEDEVLEEMIFAIFRQFLQRKMINVNIVSFRQDTNIVQVHTWYPYEDDNCALDVFKLHLAETCEYSDAEPYNPIFTTLDAAKPKIPNNLHGCPLRVASSVIEPYVFYDSTADDFPFGTEVLMIRTICQALKMTPIFIKINETRENRIISNETGIYAKLLQQKADILIGGLDNDARIQKQLWISIPYIQDDQTWCVATARLRDLWRNIFGIYTITTWLALIAAIFLIAIVLYIFIHIDKQPNTYIWTLLIGMSAALGQYAAYEPTRVSIRVMMIFLFMYGLVMSSSFNSFLISILTRPRFKQQIDSLDLAIREQVYFTGGEVALSNYTNNDRISTYVRDNFEVCERIDQCLERLKDDVQLAIALSRLHALNSPVISQREIFCFERQQNIYSYSVAMPIKLDFHLLPNINYIIRQLFEFGLIERWDKLSQSIAKNADIRKLLNSEDSSHESRLVVLTVAHIMGAILVMIFGHILASLAFIVEQLTFRNIQKGNHKFVWMKLHQILNPKKTRNEIEESDASQDNKAS